MGKHVHLIFLFKEDLDRVAEKVDEALASELQEDLDQVAEKVADCDDGEVISKDGLRLFSMKDRGEEPSSEPPAQATLAASQMKPTEAELLTEEAERKAMLAAAQMKPTEAELCIEEAERREISLTEEEDQDFDKVVFSKEQMDIIEMNFIKTRKWSIKEGVDRNRAMRCIDRVELLVLAQEKMPEVITDALIAEVAKQVAKS